MKTRFYMARFFGQIGPLARHTKRNGMACTAGVKKFQSVFSCKIEIEIMKVVMATMVMVSPLGIKVKYDI